MSSAEVISGLARLDLEAAVVMIRGGILGEAGRAGRLFESRGPASSSKIVCTVAALSGRVGLLDLLNAGASDFNVRLFDPGSCAAYKANAYELRG